MNPSLPSIQHHVSPVKDPHLSRRRPVIGISMDSVLEKPWYGLSCDYVKAVLVAGGLPLAIPFGLPHDLIPQVVDQFDGLLLSGGRDLDPSYYRQERHPKATPIDPARQVFEFALLAEVERRRMPVLGICLGCQVLNVYRGGSLNQFIPDLTREIEHRKPSDVCADPSPGVVPRHLVNLLPDSLLGKTIGGTQISVNTRHKQSIKDLGKGLRVVATAPDGIVEGIEDGSYPLFLGVQWHPENLHDEPVHLAPVRLLVDRAAVAMTMDRPAKYTKQSVTPETR